MMRESHVRPGTNRGCLAPSVCFPILVGSKVEDVSSWYEFITMTMSELV